LVIFAVNVTFVPLQIGPAGAATILMVGISIGFTVIVILFEVTDTGLAHGSLDVRMHVITSPLFKPALE